MAGTGAQASSTLALPLQQQLAGQATYSGIFNANQGTSFGQQRQQPPPWWFKGSWSIGCFLKYVDIPPVEKVFVFRHFSFFDIYFSCILNLAILSSKQCYITALLVYHCGHLHERIMHDLFLLFPPLQTFKQETRINTHSIHSAATSQMLLDSQWFSALFFSKSF